MPCKRINLRNNSCNGVQVFNIFCDNVELNKITVNRSRYDLSWKTFFKKWPLQTLSVSDFVSFFFLSNNKNSSREKRFVVFVSCRVDGDFQLTTTWVRWWWPMNHGDFWQISQWTHKVLHFHSFSYIERKKLTGERNQLSDEFFLALSSPVHHCERNSFIILSLVECDQFLSSVQNLHGDKIELLLQLLFLSFMKKNWQKKTLVKDFNSFIDFKVFSSLSWFWFEVCMNQMAST